MTTLASNMAPHMAPTIYLVRHAESDHNISKDFSHRDPPLTGLGMESASSLPGTFPHSGSVAVILTSPLRRTLQTTIAGFYHVVDKKSVKEGGIDGGAQLIIDRDLQESSDLPCDTGSERAVLEEAFPSLDLGVLGDGWFAKEGLYAADHDATANRARRVRERLRTIAESIQTDEAVAGGRKDIVVVTHGVFMKFLTEDNNIDLPKGGWKSFTIGNGDKNEAILVALE